MESRGLHGQVWWDLNADGLQNHDEPGRAGVTVRLVDTVDGVVGNADDFLFGETTTDADGDYSFGDLGQNPYYLEFVLPVGFEFSLLNRGPDDTVDSDADPATGRTAMFTLVSGQDDTSRDAGLTDGVTVSIGNVTVLEGALGAVPRARFTVTLSQSRDREVRVDYATADGTATVVGNDYVAAMGTVVFPAAAPGGPVNRTVTVNIRGDNNPESDETFFVRLSNPVNAGLGTSLGVGTIVNDDPVVAPAPLGPETLADSGSVPPAGAPSSEMVSGVRERDGVTYEWTLTVTGFIELYEGDSGFTDFVFEVTMMGPSYIPWPVSAGFETVDGTAHAGEDYVATTGNVCFPPGQYVEQPTRQIVVKVIGDTAFEGDESFTVRLFAAMNANLDDPGTGKIRNDDPLRGLVFEDVDDNGVHDPGEPGLPYVTVEATDSAGTRHSLVTDEEGYYELGSVPPGPVFLDVNDGTLPAGSRLTTGNDPQWIRCGGRGHRHSGRGLHPERHRARGRSRIRHPWRHPVWRVGR